MSWWDVAHHTQYGDNFCTNCLAIQHQQKLVLNAYLAFWLTPKPIQTRSNWLSLLTNQLVIINSPSGSCSPPKVTILNLLRKWTNIQSEKLLPSSTCFHWSLPSTQPLWVDGWWLLTLKLSHSWTIYKIFQSRSILPWLTHHDSSWYFINCWWYAIIITHVL